MTEPLEQLDQWRTRLANLRTGPLEGRYAEKAAWLAVEALPPLTDAAERVLQHSGMDTDVPPEDVWLQGFIEGYNRALAAARNVVHEALGVDQ